MIKFQINGMKIYGFHGVLEEEREIGQFFSIDIEYTIKNEKPYPDYAEIVQRASEIFLESKYNYLEEITETICNKLLSEFKIENIKVTTRKLHPPINVSLDNIACIIEKGK